ncbi:MAG: dTDP-4-dehydrorhamnose reductase [Balneolaceae bacterium]|nr:dTDP-4-dehydrorhamnose reductase [Balneolaceae bacterium]
MKIMLLGASGQLGREWQYYFSRDSTDSHLLMPYTSSQLDITRHEEVAREINSQQPDVVINCAAYTQVDKAEEEKEKAKEINAEAVAHLASVCKSNFAKLLHYSTDYVFPGNNTDRQKYPDGYPEDHPVNPINWYGQTKWEGEEAIRTSGCRHIIIRTTWLCGRFGNNFVKTMLKYGREKQQLKVVNDQWGSPGFADEIVANSMKLCEAEVNGTYHLTSKGITNWAEFAEAIFAYSGIGVTVNPVPSEEYPTEARRPKFSKLDTSKAEKVAGVSITDWRDGLQRLLKQLKNH